jgi:hypothetical protein
VARATTGASITARWDTRRVHDGMHVVSAVATDVRGRVAVTEHRVVVRNPARPMTCFVMQYHVTVRGGTRAATPAFHTAGNDERLLAFVLSSPGTGRRTSVRGAGLRWQSVRSVHSQRGDVTVWTALARQVLTEAVVTSSVTHGSQDLTVVAMEGTGAPAASLAASGTDTRHGVSITTEESTSLVFAAGVRDSSSAAVPAGWSSLLVGGLAWVQYTNQPTRDAHATVTLPQMSSAHGGWATVAVELPGDDA